jgi:hypothetical protein
MSTLIKEGIPLRIVARWLGNTEGTILSYYSHLFPDEEQSVGIFFNEHPLTKKNPASGSGNSGAAGAAPMAEVEPEANDSGNEKKEDEDDGPEM